MPLILNNVTGCKDCLVEAESGFLTKKNDVDDLKEKMNFFIKDRSLVMKMGLKSRDFIISNFSQEKILPQFLNLYKNK
jgi:glycosyltransferase involved in cell wall biosynthesis